MGRDANGRLVITNVENSQLLPRPAPAPAPSATPPPAKVASPNTTAATASTHSSSRAVNVARDANGRIARSESAKRQFMRQTGYPNGRPGYVIDHIKPLACGGPDAPANMQWQTIAAAKAKDKVERIGCR
jgi:hypothetical protein